MIPIAKPLIGENEISRVVEVMRSGQLAHGPVVEEFERELARYCEYKHAVATSNGTTALHVALLALGVSRGDEVVVPDFTFIATANAPRFVGAKPVFVDVDEKTFNINPDAVKKAVSRKTKAIIPVSLFGQAYDVDAVQEIAREKNLHVLSDNAQAIGARWKNKKNFGDDCAVLSFYPTKNATTGEGGAVLTDNGELADKCRLYRNHGQRAQYDYAVLGYNFRMNSLEAAIGLAQLQRVDEFNEARRKNARALSELLAGVKKVETPFSDERAFHVFNQYTVKTRKGTRDALRDFLKAKEVGSAVYYPKPLHACETFNARARAPVTKGLCERVLSLPVHPGVGENDLQQIAGAVKEFYKKGAGV